MNTKELSLLLQNRSTYPLNINGMAKLFKDCSPNAFYSQEKREWMHKEDTGTITDFGGIYAEGYLINLVQDIRWAKRMIPYHDAIVALDDDKFYRSLVKRNTRDAILREAKNLYFAG